MPFDPELDGVIKVLKEFAVARGESGAGAGGESDGAVNLFELPLTVDTLVIVGREKVIPMALSRPPKCCLKREDWGTRMQSEPILDMARLGHVEILTPNLDESLRFFIDVLGMTQSGVEGDSVYLRAWDDYERHSLKFTAAKQPGLGHMALRARSPQALQRRVDALVGIEFALGWTDGDLCHGPAFLCRDPDGHDIELYYETQWYEPSGPLRQALKNQVQRFPARGCNVRRLDHWNGLAVDIKANREFFENYLGLRLTEQIVLDSGIEAGMRMTCTNKTHDFAYAMDATGTKGRLHHVTYALNSREEVSCRRYFPGKRN